MHVGDGLVAPSSLTFGHCLKSICERYILVYKLYSCVRANAIVCRRLSFSLSNGIAVFFILHLILKTLNVIDDHEAVSTHSACEPFKSTNVIFIRRYVNHGWGGVWTHFAPTVPLNIHNGADRPRACAGEGRKECDSVWECGRMSHLRTLLGWK
jgi:hypothetical protein